MLDRSIVAGAIYLPAASLIALAPSWAWENLEGAVDTELKAFFHRRQAHYETPWEFYPPPEETKTWTAAISLQRIDH